MKVVSYFSLDSLQSNSNGQGKARGVNLKMGVCSNDPSEIGSSGPVALLQPLRVELTFDTTPLADLNNIPAFFFWNTTGSDWVDVIQQCELSGFTGLSTTYTAPENATGVHTIVTFICHFTQFALFEVCEKCNPFPSFLCLNSLLMPL